MLIFLEQYICAIYYANLAYGLNSTRSSTVIVFTLHHYVSFGLLFSAHAILVMNLMWMECH